MDLTTREKMVQAHTVPVNRIRGPAVIIVICSSAAQATPQHNAVNGTSNPQREGSIHPGNLWLFPPHISRIVASRAPGFKPAACHFPENVVLRPRPRPPRRTGGLPHPANGGFKRPNEQRAHPHLTDRRELPHPANGGFKRLNERRGLPHLTDSGTSAPGERWVQVPQRTEGTSAPDG